MSINTCRRASDQGMDPEKRPAEATKSGPIESGKRLRVNKFKWELRKRIALKATSPLGQVDCVGEGKDNYLKARVLDSSDENLVQKQRVSRTSIQPFSFYSSRVSGVKMIPIPGIKDAQVAGDSLLFGVKRIPLPGIKDAQVAGDSSTKIIQENPEGSGDYPTGNDKKPEPESIIKESVPAIPFFDEDSESDVDDPPTKIMQEKPEAAGETDKKPLSKCMLCGKITDHNFFNCPKREWARKMLAYCKVCNEAGHDHSDCPKATEDVLKNLRFCSICNKNTDHDTYDCTKENAILLIDGVRIINVCDLCRQVGHRGKDCSLNSEDLQFGLDDLAMDDDW